MQWPFCTNCSSSAPPSHRESLLQVSLSQLQHSTINSHSKNPPGNISTCTDTLRSSGTELRSQQEFRLHCQKHPSAQAGNFCYLWPGIINLCLCWPRHSPGPVPGELFWLSAASNLNWCSQGYRETSSNTHGVLLRCILQSECSYSIFGVNISHSPVHLPRG